MLSWVAACAYNRDVPARWLKLRPANLSDVLSEKPGCTGNFPPFVIYSRERFTGLEVGQPEIDEDTPGKAFVYFTAMVRGNGKC